MKPNTPTELNRNGARPKYELLCIDTDDYHWLWRTTDDAVFVLDGRECIRRLTLRYSTPEALVAQVVGERGVESQYHATGTFADHLCRQLERDA